MTTHYEPSKEELFIGYHCETKEVLQNKSEPKLMSEVWMPYNIENEDAFHYIVCRLGGMYDEVRTPYLTKQQVEAEGWKFDFKSDTFPFYYFHTDRFELQIVLKYEGVHTVGYSGINTPHIVIKYRNVSEDRCVYAGACPSVNELRKIMKLVGVVDAIRPNLDKIQSVDEIGFVEPTPPHIKRWMVNKRCMKDIEDIKIIPFKAFVDGLVCNVPEGCKLIIYRPHELSPLEVAVKDEVNDCLVSFTHIPEGNWSVLGRASDILAYKWREIVESQQVPLPPDSRSPLIPEKWNTKYEEVYMDYSIPLMGLRLSSESGRTLIESVGAEMSWVVLIKER